jgi:hypothetical protein
MCDSQGAQSSRASQKVLGWRWLQGRQDSSGYCAVQQHPGIRQLHPRGVRYGPQRMQMSSPRCLFISYVCCGCLIQNIFTGIAAANYSHVHHFPSRAAYDTFYGHLLRLVNCAFLDLAPYFQRILVNHLRMHVSADFADWYEKYWTGARGRYWLCHSTHG